MLFQCVKSPNVVLRLTEYKPFERGGGEGKGKVEKRRL